MKLEQVERKKQRRREKKEVCCGNFKFELNLNWIFFSNKARRAGGTLPHQPAQPQP